MRNKKGVTLLEIVVGLMIMSVLAVTAASLVMPVMRVYVNANELAEYNALLDNVANKMVRDLSLAAITEPQGLGTADDITITTNTGILHYTISNGSGGNEAGVLLRNNTPVFSKLHYRNKSVSFVVTAPVPNERAYILSLTVSSDDSTTSINREYAVRPLTLNQYN